MSLIFFLLAGLAFVGGLIWVIIASASGKRVGPPIAVMLSSILLGFLGIASCGAEIINMF